MQKTLLAFAAALALTGTALADQAGGSAGGSGKSTMNSFYDLKTTTLVGNKPVDLGSYRGKVTLVVNVASYCGYTPQYKGLEALHRELSGKGFAVLGFPSNDFGEQEPGSAEEIAQFCKLTYDVTFPMFAKVETQGPNQSPIYRYLGTSGHLPAWNFAKYLIGKDGRVIAFFPSDVTPESRQLRTAITQALTMGGQPAKVP
jgi:glutathione peroxidase